jgi:hypothetical protein
VSADATPQLCNPVAILPMLALSFDHVGARVLFSGLIASGQPRVCENPN